MNENLSEVLREFVDAEVSVAAATASDPVREARVLSRRVVRRRALRTGGTVLSMAVVGASVVVGVHAWAPEASPSATRINLAEHPSPSPSVSTPSPSASTAPAALPAVTTDPLLPVAEPMTAGMLEAADPSWRLLRYQAWADLQGEGSPAVVYLLSPDARLFEVPTPSEPEKWELLDWLPGTPLALVQSTLEPPTRVIDLLSGATVLDLGENLRDARFLHDGTRDIVLPAEGTLRRVSMDNSVRATSSSFSVPYGSKPWMPSPDGSAVLLNDDTGPRVLTSTDFAPTAMPSPYPARPDACRAWMWVTETEVLMECATGGAQQFQVAGPSEFWLTTMGGAPRLLSGMPEAARIGGLWRVGDRLVTGSFGATEAAAAWWEVENRGTAPLSTGGTPDLTVVDVWDTELIAISRSESSQHADGATSVASLVAIDPFRGTTRPLIVPPAAAGASLGVAPSSFGGVPQTDVGD